MLLLYLLCFPQNTQTHIFYLQILIIWCLLTKLASWSITAAAAAAAKSLQSCPTLRDPMDCSPPGSSAHGISRQKYWGGVPSPSLSECKAFLSGKMPEWLHTLLLYQCFLPLSLLWIPSTPVFCWLILAWEVFFHLFTFNLTFSYPYIVLKACCFQVL